MFTWIEADNGGTAADQGRTDSTMETIIGKCLPTYAVDDKIGEGLYGSVYRIHDRFKQRAVKVVPLAIERSISMPDADALDARVSQDFRAVQDYYDQIKGPGVVEVHDFHLVDKTISDTQAKAHLIILMQLCRTNLLDYVVDRFPLSATRVQLLLADLATTLHRLATAPEDTFLLTDLKPSNLLLDENGKVLIGDLGGLKRLASLSASVGAQFTPNWSAPEFLLSGAKPNIASAVYSFGLVAYFTCQGELPYPEANFTERILHIKTDGLEFQRSDLPDTLTDIIRECVAHDPVRRPQTFEALAARLAPNRAQPPVAPIDKPPPVRTDTADAATVSQTRDDVPPTISEPALANHGFRPGQLWRDPVTGMAFSWVPAVRLSQETPYGRVLAEALGEPPSEAVLNGFWMGTTPVTQGQWQRLMGENPSQFAMGQNYPVEKVSWDQAVDFIRRLNERHRRRYRFRLPKEIEWVHGALAGALSLAPAMQIGVHQNNPGTTRPVAAGRPNAFGLFDMCGNVMQWCADNDGADDTSTQRRVASAYLAVGNRRPGRGGSWKQDPADCHPGHADRFAQQLGYSHLGFRVMRSHRV